MKWPWVSRERFETQRESWAREAATWELCLAEWQERCSVLHKERNDLLEKYHALRQQGHAIPEPRPTAQPVVEEFPAAVETAITVAAEGNKGLERHLRTRARIRLARGEDHSAVARLIEKGDGSDD